MKFQILTCLILWMGCVLLIPSARADQDAPALQSEQDIPIAFVSEPVYQFESVADGIRIRHDFIIGNTGGMPLMIEKVATSCGCTTASHTKEIAPGGQGKIAIVANTEGYGGRNFSKRITVHTNDPKNKTLIFQLSGNVNKFAEIHPKAVHLRGKAGQSIWKSVSIIPDEKSPFKILDATATKGVHIRFALKDKADGYVLNVENLMKTKGRYSDTIHLKTDHAEKPEIIIRIYGNISESSS